MVSYRPLYQLGSHLSATGFIGQRRRSSNENRARSQSESETKRAGKWERKKRYRDERAEGESEKNAAATAVVHRSAVDPCKRILAVPLACSSNSPGPSSCWPATASRLATTDRAAAKFISSSLTEWWSLFVLFLLLFYRVLPDWARERAIHRLNGQVFFNVLSRCTEIFNDCQFFKCRPFVLGGRGLRLVE